MRLIWLVVAGVAALGWTPQVDAPDNEELAGLFEADQADRKLPAEEIDWWQVVGTRDRERLDRIKELYEEGELKTGRDWFRAAVVLQHSHAPEDHLLAHEMCIAALVQGERGAASLAAASEDRFLMGIGRKQRFGTQFVAHSIQRAAASCARDRVLARGLAMLARWASRRAEGWSREGRAPDVCLSPCTRAHGTTRVLDGDTCRWASWSGGPPQPRTSDTGLAGPRDAPTGARP
jgi:hypothetical protein